MIRRAYDVAAFWHHDQTRFSGDPASGPDYSRTGVRGDPTLASAEKGRALLAEMARELVEGLVALYPDLRS